jgi:hypothetical protein
VDLWSWDEGKVVQTLPHDGQIEAALFDAQDRFLASWTRGGQLKIWSKPKTMFAGQPVEGPPLRLMMEAEIDGGIASVRFHPQRDLISVVSRSGFRSIPGSPIKIRAIGPIG